MYSSYYNWGNDFLKVLCFRPFERDLKIGKSLLSDPQTHQKVFDFNINCLVGTNTVLV